MASNKAFLERVFKGDRLSLTDDKEQLMAVVGKIFFATTGKALHDYVNIIFMDKADWNRFKLRIRGNADELNNFDAIHLGGLIVVGAEGDDRILPLLFHEAGHSLYPASDDRFTDELRAYYFQRICTEILHKQLQGLGLFYRYTEQHEDDVFPSMEHKNAYHSASALYLYQ